MSFGKSSKDETSTIPNGSTSSVLAPSTKPEAFLGKGCKVVGTLTFAGPVEIEGTIEGEIIAQDRLTIGETASIKGKVSGSEITVKGEVHGDIVASKKLSLKRPARINGNIASAMLSVEEGVSFEGKCSMNITGQSGSGLSKGSEQRGATLVSISEKVA